MPEGPEIRRAADQIEAAIRNTILEDVILTPAALSGREDELIGACVTRIDTRGKAMLTRFDNGLVMYSHNQLYGRWLTSKLPKRPRSNRSLRVSLETETHVAQLFSATDIDLFDEQDIVMHPFLRNVGPDVLDSSTTAATVAERLNNRKYRGRSLGNFFLEQGFVAGIGNYLRSEILWAAGVSPQARPKDLNDKELRGLARETLSVCRRAYRQRGVTVRAALAKQLRASGLSFQQYRHYAFGREHAPCYNCASEIRRTNMAGRKLFFCPTCQRR